MADPQTYDEFEGEVTRRRESFVTDYTEILNGIEAGHWLTLNPAVLASFKWVIRPQLEEKLPEVVERVRDEAGKLVGDPPALMALTASYQDVRKALLVEGRSWEQELADLKDHWTGDAVEDYEIVAKEQATALETFSDAMSKAAEGTAKAAKQILQLWSDFLEQIAEAYASALDAIAGFGYAGKIVTLEIPALLETLAHVIRTAEGFAKVARDFVISQSTTATASWADLEAGDPFKGWPPVIPATAEDIADPRSWEAS